MSVNLSKYQTELSDAYKDVLNDKSSTDWALFGYERQTNDLKVIAAGDGGLEELVDELNCGLIMYAFCRVIDPNTGLPKFVFINWQGEGAPPSRKGSCTNHIVAVSNFFKGAHITINARTEDDVESEAVLERVAKASASVFNFKDRSDPVENMAPVGSVYKRIHPTQEINPREREKFWEKEQAEEKRRVVEERQKADIDRKKLDAERKEREIAETAARDEVVRERIRSISQVKEAERTSAVHAADKEKVQWEKQLQEDAKDEKERKVRSESLRKERSFEAQNLISQRTINARAIFEKNTYAGQLSSVQNPKQSRTLQNYESQFRESEFAQEEEGEKLSEQQDQHPEAEVEEVLVVSPKEEEKTTKELHYTKNLLNESLSLRQNSELESNAEEEEQNWDEPTLEAPPDVKDPLTEMLAEHGIVQPSPQENAQVIISSNTENVTNGDSNLRARALYDYQAADETEISFDPGDVITQVEQIDEGWWHGVAPDGSYGLFPANYVELLN